MRGGGEDGEVEKGDGAEGKKKGSLKGQSLEVNLGYIS